MTFLCQPTLTQFLTLTFQPTQPKMSILCPEDQIRFSQFIRIAKKMKQNLTKILTHRVSKDNTIKIRNILSVDKRYFLKIGVQKGVRKGQVELEGPQRFPARTTSTT